MDLLGKRLYRRPLRVVISTLVGASIVKISTTVEWFSTYIVASLVRRRLRA